MSGTKRCKSCGNPVDLEIAQEHDGACPWCLAAFTFSPEPVGNPVTASKDPSKQFGKYVRTDKLGAGGMGEVWKALDTELNRWVALKFVKDDDPSSTARFQREARTAASLAHAGIASIHEVGEVDGRHFIAMQYVQGRTMASFPKNDRRLLVRLFKDAARALDHAHRHGVIHRDLKPDNLMVEEREDGWHIVILDFGLARPIEGGEKLSKSGEVYGTAAYMSPEQARGEHLDERADVYSLGATMYEVLTGRPPFRGANLLELLRKVGAEEPLKPRKINPRIHRDLETIILKCLEKNRDRRYANARELAEDLERFLNSDPILARPPSTLYRLTLAMGKRKAVAATAAAAVVVIAAGAVYVIPRWIEATRAANTERARTESRGRAQPHVDLARAAIQRMEQLLTVDADRRAELEREGRVASDDLEKALAAHPKHEEAFFEMARLRLILGYHKDASGFFSRAIEASPGMAKAYLERALLNLEFYERLRHESLGGVKAETEASSKLRTQIMGDLSKVREWSRELPQLKHADAMQLFAEGKYGEAADRWAEYLRQAPADADAWCWRGHALYHADRNREAIAAHDQALKLRPRMLQALTMRGISRREVGDNAGAIQDLDKAIEIDPRQPKVHGSRGMARSNLKDYEGAVRDYNLAIELDPNDATSFMNRGNVRAKLREHAKALKDHDRAVELAPDRARCWYNRAITKEDLKDHEGALRDYDKAIELDPTDASFFRNRGNVRRVLKNLAAAIEDYERAIELEPRNPNSYNCRGSAKADLGDLTGAVKDYDKAIEVDPGFVLAYYNRGGVKFDLRDYRGAIENYDKSIELEPGNATTYNNRGNSYSCLRDYRRALLDYDKSIELDPKAPLTYANRGHAHMALRNPEGALRDWTQGLKLAPSNSPIRSNLQKWIQEASAAREFDEAFRLQNAGKQREAIEKYKAVIEAAPRNPRSVTAAYNIACAYAQLGQKNDALDWLERAVEMGWTKVDHLESDSDLDSLRNEERYRKLVARLKSE